MDIPFPPGPWSPGVMGESAFHKNGLQGVSGASFKIQFTSSLN